MRPGSLDHRVWTFKTRCIVRILRRARGNIAEAARLAGRDRKAMYNLLRNHNIDPKLYRPAPPAASCG
jgi:DNA-binding NtrC family response regulator